MPHVAVAGRFVGPADATWVLQRKQHVQGRDESAVVLACRVAAWQVSVARDVLPSAVGVQVVIWGCVGACCRCALCSVIATQ